jgi:hypothetical protein
MIRQSYKLYYLCKGEKIKKLIRAIGVPGFAYFGMANLI